MTKPLGLHIHSRLRSDLARDYILRVRPSVVKWLAEGIDDELVRLARANGAMTVGREYFADQAVEGSLASDHLERIRQAIRRHPQIMAWEGVNEAFQGGDALSKRAAFDLKLMRVCEEEGVKAAIGSFSVGQPANMDDWRLYLPALRYAAQGGHYVALHEYGGAAMQWGVGGNQASALDGGRWTQIDPATRPGVDGWFVLRYRKALARWRELGLTSVPRIIITESGLDDIQPRPNVGQRRGYKTYRGTEWADHPILGDYARQLRWTCERWAEDPEVVGGVDFGFADASNSWDDFDISTDRPTLERLIEEMQGMAKARPATPDAPAAATVLGIDVSRWQGRMDWRKAASAGARFAYCKASEGTGWTDPEWARNAASARAAGVLVGGYHYYLNAYDPIEQARHFVRVLNRQPGDLPPAADFEDTKTPAKPEDMRRFLVEVERLTGVRPVIYTGAWWWDSSRMPARVPWASSYPLWIASYRAGAPALPDDWRTWAIHQYTSSGPGRSFGAGSDALDMNRFNGTLADLRAFAGGRAAPGGDPAALLGETLLSVEPELQTLRLNPSAALQRAITAAGAGWQVTGPEQAFAWGGSDYVVQRAENLTTGRVRVYYVPVGRWSDVSHVERP